MLLDVLGRSDGGWKTTDPGRRRSAVLCEGRTLVEAGGKNRALVSARLVKE